MVAFWSFNYITTKVALREFPSLLLAPLRTLFAGVVILPIYFGRRRKRSCWTLREGAALVVLGVCGVALNQVFFVLGLARTSVAHGAILIALTPVQVLLLAAAIGQEKLTWSKLTGLGVALSGVAVLQISHAGGAAPSVAGDAFILLSGFSLAVYSVFGKTLTSRHDAVTMNTFAYAGGAVALAPMIFWNARGFDFRAVTPLAWMSLLYMAVFSSVVSYLIYNFALSRMAASRVSAFSYLQPLMATAMAIPILGEHLTRSLFAGGALVLSGVWMTERG
jgi:drug/metabolite transporter (DMT)-like permease